MATLEFNRCFERHSECYRRLHKLNGVSDCDSEEWNYYIKYRQAVEKGAMFDVRCFNVPKEEVVNCFLWRQQDATKNAIQLLGRCVFSDKELYKKNGSQIQDMLMTERSINFNDMPTAFKRGVCCIRKADAESSTKMTWCIDEEIPIFSQDRDYIERFV